MNKRITGNSPSFAIERDLELVQRSKSGVLIYLISYAIILFFFDFNDAYPALSIVFLFLFIVGTALRLYASQRCLAQIAAGEERSCFLLFYAGTLMLALTWGVFCFYVINSNLFPVLNIAILVVTAGFLAGTGASLGLHFRFFIAYVLTVMFPVMLACVLQNSMEYFSLVILYAIYVTYILLMAKKNGAMFLRRYMTIEQLDRKTHALVDLNQEISNVTKFVASEFSEPLRAIRGFGQALLEDASDRLLDQDKDYVERILSATERLNKYNHAVNSLASIDVTSVNREELEFSVMTRSVYDRIASSQVKSSCDFKVEEHIIAYADHTLTIKLLEILLDNAVKRTQDLDEPSIKVGTVESDPEQIYVEDNGTFAYPKDSEKLFLPFEVGGVSSEKGISLGLAMAKRIVALHGGIIFVQDAGENRSRIVFELPSGLDQ